MDYNDFDERDCNEFPPVDTFEDVTSESEDEINKESEDEVKKEETKVKNTRGKKVKVEEKVYETVAIKYNAKVIQATKNGYTGVSIYEHGIKIATSESYKVGDTIEIQYEGTIGKSDFKITGAR